MWLFWIDCKNPCRLYVDIVVRCGACQLVHSTIGLREWIEKRPNLSSSLHCELCRRPYSIRLTKRIAWTRRNLCRCQPCGYLAEAFVLLLGLIVLGVSLVEIIRMMKKKSKKRPEEVILLCVIVVIAASIVLGLLRVLRKWLQLMLRTVVTENRKAFNSAIIV